MGRDGGRTRAGEPADGGPAADPVSDHPETARGSAGRDAGAAVREGGRAVGPVECAEVAAEAGTECRHLAA